MTIDDMDMWTTKESYVTNDTIYPEVWSTSFKASIISVRNEVTSP